MDKKQAENSFKAILDYIVSIERENETLKRMNSTLQEKLVNLENSAKA